MEESECMKLKMCFIDLKKKALSNSVIKKPLTINKDLICDYELR